jgi:AraC family transcriptional regulator
MKPQTWTSYEDRLNRVTAYIYDHLDDNLDMDTLAGVAALSPFHWHRIYSSVRGETLTAAVKRLRLQRAGADLALTQRPLGEVAERAGYGGVQAFTRAFSDAYGMPPASYRDSGSHKDFQPGRLEAPNASWRIETRSVAAMTLIGLPHRGSYMDIGRAFEQGYTHALGRKLMPDVVRLIGVYYDDPGLVAEAELRSFAAVVVTPDVQPAPPIERIDVVARDYAVLRYKGPYSDMRAAYAWLFGTWLPQSGREAADAPMLEEYLNSPHNTPPAELLTDLMLPLS